MPKANKDTRTELREMMDELCVRLVRESKRLKGDGNASEWRETIKVVTGYLSMANREPTETEGGDFAKYRAQLSNGAGGGGDTGEPEGDPDAPEAVDDAEPADGEPAETPAAA